MLILLPLYFVPVISHFSLYFNYLTQLSLPLLPKFPEGRYYGSFVYPPDLSLCALQMFVDLSRLNICGLYTCSNGLTFFSDDFILV